MNTIGVHEYFLLKVDTGKAFCIDYLGIHVLGINQGYIGCKTHCFCMILFTYLTYYLCTFYVLHGGLKPFYLFYIHAILYKFDKTQG